MDRSFEFLLRTPRMIPEKVVRDKKGFLAFFAGYTDAEGSFRIYKQEDYAAYSFRINSEDEFILRQSARALRAMRYHVYFKLATKPNAIIGNRRNVWSLGMFRKDEIAGLLKELPLQHDEKTSWQRLMIVSAYEPWGNLQEKAFELRSSIKDQVMRYCEVAEDRKKSHDSRESMIQPTP